MSHRHKSTTSKGKGRDDWQTPKLFWENLCKSYDFCFDLAASPENTKCKNFYTKADNSLDKDWHETYNKFRKSSNDYLYLNPPYNSLAIWYKKCAESTFSPKVLTRNGIRANVWPRVLMLVPASTDTKYFHDYAIKYAAEIILIKGRISFELPNDEHLEASNSPGYPSMLIAWYKRNTPFPVFKTMTNEGIFIE